MNWDDADAVRKYMAEASAKHYRANHEKRKQQLRDQTKRRKSLVFEHYSLSCACCAETNIHFLTIDHIDGDGSSHRKVIGQGGRAFYQWLIKNNFPGRFQMLCFNCNHAKSIYGVCPHQEIT